MSLDALVRDAREILDGNRRGDHTIPAPGLYPHQWSWDTAFIAIGRSRVDQAGAETEMLRLFEAQWRTGMLPHIRFSPDVPADAYFPGPDFWLCPEVASEAPAGIATSGITQPPVHAMAALEMHRRATDPERSLRFLSALRPGLVALHRYLRDRRTGLEGLARIVHPWESGMDNSPAWDEALREMHIPDGALPAYERRDLVEADPDDRPRDEAYDRFVYLAVLYRDAGYDDERIREETPFLVEDPMFNAIWADASAALAEISRLVGEDGREFAEDAERIVRALESRLWDPRYDRFFPYHAREGHPMSHHSIASFVPLLAPGLDQHVARRLIGAMDAVRHCDRPTCFVYPSYDRLDEEFDERRYWRGPIWINTDWLLLRGAQTVGAAAVAHELRTSIIELVRRAGFREYFHPHGDGGYGAHRFAWTAALALDVALGG